MKTPALTSKQAKWVGEYLVCGNATASAVIAGYSVKGASVAGNRMLRNANVQKALQVRQAADAVRLCLRREDVLAGLLEAAAIAKLQSDPGGMVAAWKQVGLLMGYNGPQRIKVNLSGEKLPQPNQLDRLSDAELLALMASGGGGGAAAH